MDHAYGYIVIAMSIIGAAVRIGHVLGKINTKLEGIDKHLEKGTQRMDQTDLKVQQHDVRITRVETLVDG